MDELVGARLKLMRVRVGIRPTRLARELGITAALLCDWEDGRQQISPRQAARVREALDRLAPGFNDDGRGHRQG